MFMEMQLERAMGRVELEERRLTNRSAFAALVAVALAFAGVVGAATIVRAEEPVALQALATAPLPLSILMAAWAYRLRVRLAEVEGRKAEVRSALDVVRRAQGDPGAEAGREGERRGPSVTAGGAPRARSASLRPPRPAPPPR